MSAVAPTISARETITPILATLGRKLSDKENTQLKKSIGVACAQMIASQFMALASARHHDGAPTNFYADAAKAVSRRDAVQAIPGAVTIEIDQEGIAQRRFGGDIDAKEGSALTIPVADEAYGHRAREFDNLILLIVGPQHVAVLAARGEFGPGSKSTPTKAGTRKKGTATHLDRLVIMYLLVKRVHQDPDPTVLPTDQALLGAASIAAKDYVDRLLEGSQS
jgi:hypothetical protein